MFLHVAPPMNLHDSLAQLTAELDPETVAELIEQFCADTPRQMIGLREAYSLGDLQSLSRLAHSVAGSSSTFGLADLRAAARLVEDTALSADLSPLPAQIEAMSAVAELALSQLQEVIRR